MLVKFCEFVVSFWTELRILEILYVGDQVRDGRDVGGAQDNGRWEC